ncbi:MAG: Tim44-like domain-containing protein [Casimicrobium sp.]|jgi:predicted lipid-binding transport protein (Tim44 family)
MLKTLSITIAALALAFCATTVDAKKFGGGKSIGAQRSSVSDAKSGVSPSSAPANAAMAAPAAGAAGAAAAAKPSMMSRMAGPLMGIAAGLGLGYLFSQMGAGGFMGFILIALLGVAAAVYFGRKMMNKQAAATAGGAGGMGTNSATPYSRTADVQPMQYAGTAASGAAVAAAPVMASGLAGGFGIPAGFDKSGFEDQAKKQFMSLQAANDKGDLDAVRDFSTDEFYNQIAKDVVGGNKDATHVEELQANLMGIETERGQYWASVEFTGKMREDGMVMGSAFSEVWNLIKPVDGSKGWLVAGIQQA